MKNSQTNIATKVSSKFIEDNNLCVFRLDPPMGSATHVKYSIESFGSKTVTTLSTCASNGTFSSAPFLTVTNYAPIEYCLAEIGYSLDGVNNSSNFKKLLINFIDKYLK